MNDLRAAVIPSGDLTMPDWLYRIARFFVPALREQERRIAETARVVSESKRIRTDAMRVQRLIHSYTRANRRLSDVRNQ